MKKTEAAVLIINLTKSFRIPLEAHNGLKQRLVNALKGRRGYRVFTPLKDINFDIQKGDFFGIVGKNGSGKSTLLKTIAGIYTPTEGIITVNGKLVPFIELGVGFNPELTGRENVFLNGALLGFSRSEMNDMYNDIVEFAELENFMEERLKNYSSGMQVRLAFSIAIRARGDVLLLDEVLAVGDESFQKKCFEYFNQLKREKKTVILVTHDMSAVEEFCNDAIMIEKGKIVLHDRPHKVAAAYSRSNDKTQKTYLPQASDAPFEVKLLDANDNTAQQFEYGETLKVEVVWKHQGVKNVGVAIFRANGEYVFGPNTYQDKIKVENKKLIQYSVKLNLGEGEYFIKAGLMGSSDKQVIEFIEEGPHFVINRDYEGGRWGGVTKLDYTWKK